MADREPATRAALRGPVGCGPEPAAAAGAAAEWKEALRTSLPGEEFLELPRLVKELVQAERATQRQIRALVQAQARLAEAQAATEGQVRALVEPQRRTEQVVEALAEAQNRSSSRGGICPHRRCHRYLRRLRKARCGLYHPAPKPRSHRNRPREPSRRHRGQAPVVLPWARGASMRPEPEAHTEIEARGERLLAELERLRQLLAPDPRVRGVVVFGSLATGEVHAWSDLDVVVVMDTQDRFVERISEIRRRLRPRVGMDLLVYTPEELRRLGHRLFMREEILKKGKVMPLHPEREAEEWLTFAEDDLRMARLGLREGIYAQVCFHAQQCAEKCLKALLAREGRLIPRTHRIDDLWEEIPEAAHEALAPIREYLAELDGYYTITRYPDALAGIRPEGLPGRAEAERALQVAERCWQTVRALIGGAG